MRLQKEIETSKLNAARKDSNYLKSEKLNKDRYNDRKNSEYRLEFEQEYTQHDNVIDSGPVKEKKLRSRINVAALQRKKEKVDHANLVQANSRHKAYVKEQKDVRRAIRKAELQPKIFEYPLDTKLVFEGGELEDELRLCYIYENEDAPCLVFEGKELSEKEMRVAEAKRVDTSGLTSCFEDFDGDTLASRLYDEKMKKPKVGFLTKFSNDLTEKLDKARKAIFAEESKDNTIAVEDITHELKEDSKKHDVYNNPIVHLRGLGTEEDSADYWKQNACNNKAYDPTESIEMDVSGSLGAADPKINPFLKKSQAIYRNMFDRVKKGLSDLNVVSKKFQKLVSTEIKALDIWLGHFEGQHSSIRARAIDGLVRSILVIYQLIRAKNYADRFAAIYNFFPPGYLDTSLMMTICKVAGIAGLAELVSFMGKRVGGKIDTLSFEGGSFDDIIDFLKTSVNCSNSQIIRDLLVSLASFQFFKKDIATTIFRSLGKPTGSCIMDAVVESMDGIAKMLKVSKLVLAGVPISEAWFANDPIEQHLLDARKLMAFKDSLYSGMPVEGKIHRKDFYCQGRAICEFFEETMKKMNPKKKVYSQMLDMYIVLLAEVNKIACMCKAENRTAPFAVLIHGSPGIGKSNLVNFVFYSYARVCGRDYDESHVYCRNSATDFWEGYDNQSQWGIHCPEMGSIAAELAGRMGDAAITEFTSIVDSNKFMCNMAFKGKGEVPFLGELVVADCNDPSLNLKKLVNNCAAVERRFLYIEVVVKEDMREPGFPGIDASKMDKSRYFDKWHFSVYEKKALSANQSQRIDYMTGRPEDDIYALSALLKQKFSSHIELQKKNRQAYIDDLKIGYDVMPDGVTPVHFTPLKQKEGIELLEEVAGVERTIEQAGRDRVSDVEMARKIFGPAKRERGVNPSNLDNNRVDGAIFEFDEGEGLIHGELGFEAGENDARNPSPIDFSKKGYEEGNLPEDLYKGVIFGDVPHAVAPVDEVKFPAVVEKPVEPSEYVYQGFDKDKKFPLVKVVPLKQYEIPKEKKKAPWFDPIAMATWVFSWTQLGWRFSWLTSSCAFQYFWTFMLSFSVMCLPWPSLVKTVLVKFKEQAGIRAKYKWNHLRNFVGDQKGIDVFGLGDHFVDALVYGSIGAAGIASVWAVAKLVFTERKGLVAESRDYVTPSMDDEKLNNFEEKTAAGTILACVPVKGTKSWNTIEGIRSPLHTGTMETLKDSMASNVVHMIIEGEGFSGITNYGVGIKSCFIVTNSHAFPKRDKLSVRIRRNLSDGPNPQYKSTILGSKDIDYLPNDICVIKVSGWAFKDKLGHFFDSNNPPGVVSGLLADNSIETVYDDRPFTLDDPKAGKSTITGHLNYIWEGHYKGACGLPIFGQFQKGAVILGIHIAGWEKSKLAHGSVTFQQMLRDSCERLENSSELMCPSSQSGTFYQSLPLRDMCHKSPMRYEEIRGMDLFGTLAGNIKINNTSKVTRTYLEAEDLDELFLKCYGFKRTESYGPPMMIPCQIDGQYVSPYNIAIRKLNDERPPLHKDLLEKITIELSDKIVDNLAVEGITEIAPFTVEQAINGIPGTSFKRINASKSAGFGLKGPKCNHLPIKSEEGGYVYREPTPELRQEIAEILSRYDDNEYSGQFYNVALKDEPRETSKIKSGKTRPFCVGPLAFLIVCRMYLGPLFNLMMEHGAAFYCCIGIDTHRQGQALFDTLDGFSKCLKDGDYGKFDLHMLYDISLTAYSTILRICKRLGFNESALRIVKGILSDMLFPFFIMCNDIFRAEGKTGSGGYGTTEVNCFRNLIMSMYVFYCLIWCFKEFVDEKFFDNVEPRTFGDDNIEAIKEKVIGVYNNVTFQRFVELYFKMEYTRGAKTAKIVTHVPIEEVVFLKRTFQKSRIFGDIRMPLSLESIHKTLCWYIPSKEVSVQDQLLDTIKSVLYELMFHGTEKEFNLVRCFLLEKYVHQYAVPVEEVAKRLPCFSELKEKLCSQDDEKVLNDVREVRHTTQINDICDALARANVDSDDECESDHENPSLKLGYEGGPLGDYDDFGGVYCQADEILNESEQLKQRMRYLGELKEADEQLSMCGDPTQGMSVKDVRTCFEYQSNAEYRTACEKFLGLKARYDTLVISIRILDRAIARRNTGKVRFESGEVSVMEKGTVDASTITTHENVQDIAGDAPVTTMVGMENYTNTIFRSPLSMDDVWSRPIQISTYPIAIATDVDVAVDPWTVLSNNPFFRAKAKQIALCRPNILKIRIAISGTPFHSGRVLAAYVPCHLVNEGWQAQLAVAGLRANRLKYLSQTPGSKSMDVRDNTPVEFTIPFVSPQPALRLFNNATAALSDATAFADFANLGSLYLYTLNQVKCVSASPSAVSVYVYAWFEDMVLGCATGSIGVITTESGDERKTGPVEMVASRASEVASALSVVPGIGPFAKASSMALSGIAKLAALLGWSVPTLNTVPGRMKNEPFQNEAQVIGCDTGKRITLDPKQELSVDPRIVGVTQDEMSLAFLTSVDSLLTTFTWDNSTVPLSSVIWNAIVHPRTGNAGIVSGAVTCVQPTCLAYASVPFEFWRGDITYRFDIVCSNFHRGKLAIYYEPNVSQEVLIDATLDLHKQYMCVVDIQETQSIEVCVKWASPKAWLRQLTQTLVNTSMGTITVPLTYWGFANGYIGVTPLTALQSPDDSDVYVNVYVRSENMQFNQFSHQYMPSKRIQAESGEIETDGVSCFVLNPPGAGDMGLCELYFGERPISFRSLLKRPFTSAFIAAVAEASPVKNVNIRSAIFPPTLPSFTTALGAVFSPRLFCYLKYAYVGMKGGMKKRFRIVGGSGTVGSQNSEFHQGHTKVSIDLPAAATAATTIGYLGYANPNQEYMSGTVTFVPLTQAGVEFELPFYSNNLFIWANNQNHYVTTDPKLEPWMSRTYYLSQDIGPTGTTTVFVEETSTGEDFSFMRFVAAPPYSY